MAAEFNEELGSLDRHFIWADYFRNLYRGLLEKGGAYKEGDTVDFFIRPIGIGMCFWYANLYVVLEGVEAMKLELPAEIQKEVSEIKGPLRHFRNAIDHHQEKYWDKRLFEIMEDKNSVRRINTVHEFLNQHLMELMGKPKN